MAGLVRRLRRLGRHRSSADPSAEPFAAALDDHERSVLERCQPYTMTTAERLVATMDAVGHVVRRPVPGALVECGVWRGGSVLAMILTLQRLGVDDREIYLYDTFTGMTAPTDDDTSAFGPPATETYSRAQRSGDRAWSHVFGPEAFGRAKVEALLETTGYPAELLHVIEGPVEDTIPAAAPDDISLVRLDTDWYESTKHEMLHLYPRLASGGVLLIDDYGHWRGSRKAVDEYFAEHGDQPLLVRTDYTGRVAIKP